MSASSGWRIYGNYSRPATQPSLNPAPMREPWNIRELSQNLVARRSLKSAAALAVAALVVWFPVQRLFQATSVEAVVKPQADVARSHRRNCVVGSRKPRSRCNIRSRHSLAANHE